MKVTYHMGGKAVLRVLRAIARIGLAGVSMAALAAVAGSSVHECKMLVWGPRSMVPVNHQCLIEDGEACFSCNSNEATCLHDTGYVDGWEICQCLCGTGANNKSNCSAVVQWNDTTGEVHVDCTNHCCIVACKDNTGKLHYGQAPDDPCKCEFP